MKQQAQARAPRVAPAAILPAAQTRHIPIKKILSVAVLAVIIVLAGLLAYHHDQRQQAAERAFAADKARFSRLEADMTALAQSIKRETGFDSSLTKSCGHTNLKFQTGDLYCLVSVTLPSSESLAYGKLKSIYETNGFFSLDENGEALWVKGVAQSVSYKSGYDCTLSEGFEGPDGSDTFKCLSSVQKPLYALAE